MTSFAGNGDAGLEIAPIAGAPASDAGSAGMAGCRADAECADALGCNGSERCVAGECVAGDGLSCPADLQCTEHGAGSASCEYTTPGRWLTYLGSDSGLFPFGLRAVRLSDNRAQKPAVWLSDGIVDDEFKMITVDTWSPDGKHMIVWNPQDIEHMLNDRLFLVELGAGQPSKPVLVKDVPVGGAVMSGPWAPDSSAVFVRAGDTPSETYLVHFESTGVRTELVYTTDTEEQVLDFCANPRWFHRTIDDVTSIVDSQRPEEAKLVWQSGAGSSPDGRWLVKNDGSLEVAPCAADSKPIQLSAESADDTSWTDDSRFLIVTRPKRVLQVLDSTQAFKKVFEGTADSHQAAGSKLLLLGAPNASDEQQLSVLDLSVSPPKKTARGKTPAYKSLGFLGDGSVWASRDEAGGLSGFWILDAQATQWRRVATNLGSASWPMFTANGAYVTFLESLPDGTHQVLAFSLLSANPMPQSLFPSPLSAEIKVRESPDGLLVERLTGLEPFEGAVWWLASSASGFAPPQLVSDVRAASEPRFQPQP